jgi:hypothetical protein
MCKPNFFAVNRSVRNHELVGYFVDGQPNPFAIVWIYMLHHAAFQDRVYKLNGFTYQLERGQLILSEHDISRMWGIPRGKVRVWLAKLTTHMMIKRDPHSSRRAARITICNYDLFQPSTTSQQPTQQPTQAQNTTHHTKKEDNKVKNKKVETRPSNDQQIDIEDAIRAAEAAAAAAVAPVEVAPKLHDVCLDQWNTLARDVGLEQLPELISSRRGSLYARLKEHGPDAFAKVLAEVRRSKLLRGKATGRAWKATLPWLLRPDNFAKVIEGTYTRRPGDCIEGASITAPGSAAPAKAQPTYEEVAILAKAARERRHQQQLERQRDQELAWANAVLADPQMSPYVPNALDDIEANVAKAKSIVVQHCLT